MASIEEKKRKKHHRKSKKTKTEKEEVALEDLRTLGNQLLSSRAHVNNVPILLSYIAPPSPIEFSLEALISLQSFFVPLAADIPAKSSVDPGQERDPERVYRAWLRERFDEFVNLLIGICVDSRSEDALKDVALDAIMDFVKLGKEGRFQSAIYHRFLHSIVLSTSPVDPLLILFAPKYFKYLDVSYFTYTSLDTIAKDCSLSSVAETKEESIQGNEGVFESRVETYVRIMYNILSRIPPFEAANKEANYETWSQMGLSSKVGKSPPNLLDGDSKSQIPKGINNEVSSTNRILKKMKLKFTRAWLSFLRLPLPLDIYKEVLVTLHNNVFPYMENPAILCDFLTTSYDIGGVISVMALSGLFVLMTQHGLEYPKFYEKLYALLTPSVFMAKHRAVFFQLLDTCLKSSHLPAYLAAAFAKKLSRLALSVPPQGGLVIIAIIHNLLRRHPSINFLVNKENDEETEADVSVDDNNSTKDTQNAEYTAVIQNQKHGVDIFRMEESNPSKSNAMRSSLWEIDSLRHHYCPAVSRFVASLENDLTVRAKTSEVTVADFSSGSYATIFGDEIRRVVKRVPLAFYRVMPSSLFSESDLPGWSFGGLPTDMQDGGNIENESSGTLEKDESSPAKKQRVEMA